MHMKLKPTHPKKINKFNLQGRVSPLLLAIVILIVGLLMDEWWWKVGLFIIIIVFIEAYYKYRNLD